VKVVNYRVWCNPTRIGKRGDDYYYEFATQKEAKQFIKTHREADRTFFEIETAK